MTAFVAWAVLTALAVLPGSAENPPSNESQAGWLAMLTVGGLIVATVLLWLSMRRHLRRIRVGPSRRESVADEVSEIDDGSQDPGSRPEPV